MQMKKEDMRLAILKEAEKEFYEKGFSNASIRNIVKAAGTTIGNFYNYFDSKETVFEALVIDEYRSFIYFLENHDKIELPEYLMNVTDVAEVRKVLTNLIKHIIPVFSDPLILLLECSQGTKYANTRALIVEQLEEHFKEHIRQSNQEYTETEIAGIIAEQLLSGLLMILKNYKDKETRILLLTEYVLFNVIGTMGLLGNGK